MAAVCLLPASLLAGCDTHNQLAPSLPRVVGLQVDGDRLRLLTGTPCEDVERIIVSFTADGEESRRTQLTAEPVLSVEQLDVGAAVTVPGFVTTEALPAGFDWRAYSEVDVSLTGPGVSVGVGSASLDPVKDRDAASTGDDTVYVRDEGWLTPQEVADGNETSFLTPCTPDPAGGAA